MTQYKFQYMYVLVRTYCTYSILDYSYIVGYIMYSVSYQ